LRLPEKSTGQGDEGMKLAESFEDWLLCIVHEQGVTKSSRKTCALSDTTPTIATAGKQRHISP
jgi:hypothetical protein